MEALALLPPARRWQVTFSTFYRSVPQDVACLWRCLPREAPEARAVRAIPGATVIDLAERSGLARGGALVEAARTGQAPRQSPSSLQPPRRAAAPRSSAEPEVAQPIRGVPVRGEPVPVARSGGWVVPFALGLLAAVLLVGGAALAGWRVLVNDRAKALALAEEDRTRELRRANDDKEAALKQARADAERDKGVALKQEREKAAQAREEAAKVAAGEKQALRTTLEKAQQKALKDEREKGARKLREEKDKLTGAIAVRDDALKAIVARLFDGTADPTDKVRKHLDAVRAGQRPRNKGLPELLKAWWDHELKIWFALETQRDLYDLRVALDRCRKTIDKEEGYTHNRKKADEQIKVIKGKTAGRSLLVREALSRHEETLKALDKAFKQGK
jgi:hypothetical protein